MSIRDRRAITAGEELLPLNKLADRRVFFSSASLLVPFVYEWGATTEDILRLFLYIFSSVGVIFLSVLTEWVSFDGTVVSPFEGDMLLLEFIS